MLLNARICYSFMGGKQWFGLPKKGVKDVKVVSLD